MSIDQGKTGGTIGALFQELQLASAQAVLLGQAVAEKLGINPTDLECMGIIAEEGAVTPGRLAELTSLTTGAITGVIDRLEKAGYVSRESDPGDRRRVIVRVVAARAQEAGALYATLQAGIARLCAGYSREQLASILDFVVNSNRITRDEIARLRGKAPAAPTRAAAGTSEGRDFAAPLAGASNGKLVFANGATQLLLRGDPALAALYQAHFEHPLPKVSQRGGVVNFRYSGIPLLMWLDWRDRPAEVKLNTTIPWALEMHGGSSKVSADLRPLRISGIEIHGGSNELTLLLGQPSGTVPIRAHGGSHKLSIQRPAGVALRLHIQYAKEVQLDGKRLEADGGDAHWESPDYRSAGNRYDIQLMGGAKDVVITTR